MSIKANRHHLPSFISLKSLITVYHVDFSNIRLKGEAHDYPEILFIAEGEHSLLLDGIEYNMHAGQIIMYAPNAYHIAAKKSHAVANIISFESDFEKLSLLCNRIFDLTDLQQQMLSQCISIGLRNFKDVQLYSNQKGMILNKNADISELHQLKNLFELFLIDLYKSESGVPVSVSSNASNHQQEQFDIVKKYLKDNIDKTLTIEDISSACSVSISVLQKLFKTYVGCGPIDYFIYLKISAAKNLIRSTSLSVTQISERLGFASVSYFSRLFKKKTGLSPSEYSKT